MKKIYFLAGILACSILPSCNRTYDNYLTFTALSNDTKLYCFRTNSFTNNLPNISYSLDKNSWHTINIVNERDTTWTPFITLNENQNVYLKGDNPTGFSRGEHEFIHFNALNNNEDVIPFSSSGNIMSLIDNGRCKEKTIPCDYCFTNMFGGTDYLDCKLTKAPLLPALRLKPHCYDHMFFDNDTLTTATELPSMKMEEKCYAYMFAQCVSLKRAPALKSHITAPYCYDHMFYGNASLEYIELHITDWDRDGNFPCCFWVSFDGTYKMSKKGKFICPRKLIPNLIDPDNFSETRVPYHWNIYTF